MEEYPANSWRQLTSGQRCRHPYDITGNVRPFRCWLGPNVLEPRFQGGDVSVNMLPAVASRLWGLGPAHAVGEMRSAGGYVACCATRSCNSTAEKRRISAARCSCSMKAQWWSNTDMARGIRPDCDRQRSVILVVTRTSCRPSRRSTAFLSSRRAGCCRCGHHEGDCASRRQRNCGGVIQPD